MSSVTKTDFHAALDRLEAMAKGGATQLHHTASDSVPGSHAGVATSDYQDEHKDGIDENGTDYSGVKKALSAKVEKSQALTPAEVAIVKGQDPRPLIAQKVSKGESLTPAELWVTKGGYAKMQKASEMPCEAGKPGEADDASSVPDTHAGKNENDEIEADAKKSLDSAVSETSHLRKGLEMSPILAEFARAMGAALQGTEARTVQAINKALSPVVERISALENSLSKSVSEQGEFNKGFAETLVGIGQHVAGNSEVNASQATLPAQAPKSQLRAVPGGQGVQAVQKSFGPGGLEVGTDALTKSQIVNTMTDMVKSGKINALEVIKFETSNQINPQTEKLVSDYLQAAGR